MTKSNIQKAAFGVRMIGLADRGSQILLIQTKYYEDDGYINNNTVPLALRLAPVLPPTACLVFPIILFLPHLIRARAKHLTLL